MNPLDPVTRTSMHATYARAEVRFPPGIASDGWYHADLERP